MRISSPPKSRIFEKFQSTRLIKNLMIEFSPVFDILREIDIIIYIQKIRHFRGLPNYICILICKKRLTNTLRWPSRGKKMLSISQHDQSLWGYSHPISSVKMGLNVALCKQSPLDISWRCSTCFDDGKHRGTVLPSTLLIIKASWTWMYIHLTLLKLIFCINLYRFSPKPKIFNTANIDFF